jgi:tripartite-type tricarboxylate transporter receptor subunit TctC
MLSLRSATAAVTALAAILAAPSVKAQTAWPNRPLKFITSFAPGASPDIVCRIVADRVSRDLGQQVVVENRPGASNVIAAQAVARAPADGYTYFFATAAAMVTNALTFKTLSYDPVKDFTPVALIGRSTFMVLVNPNVPAKTLGDLIALEKGKPGSLSFASDGPRNLSGMLGAWLNKIAGMHMVQVAYANIPQGVQDTLAGRTQVVILSITAAAPLVHGNQLRPLAVSTAKRVPGYEDVPPVADTLPGFDFSGWFGIVAPADTPPDIVRRMNQQIDQALKDPTVRTRLADGGLAAETDATPQDFSAFLAAERARWTRVVGDIGIEPE